MSHLEGLCLAACLWEVLSFMRCAMSLLTSNCPRDGVVATGLVGSPDPGCLYLPTLSDTTAQSIPACPGLAYILILCAFYPQSVVQTFLVNVEFQNSLTLQAL